MTLIWSHCTHKGLLLDLMTWLRLLCMDLHVLLQLLLVFALHLGILWLLISRQMLLQNCLLSVLVKRMDTHCIRPQVLSRWALLHIQLLCWNLLLLLLRQIIILPHNDGPPTRGGGSVLWVSSASWSYASLLLLSSISLSIFLELEQGIHVCNVRTLVWCALTLVAILVASCRILRSLRTWVGGKVDASKSQSSFSACRHRHFCLN